MIILVFFSLCLLFAGRIRHLLESRRSWWVLTNKRTKGLKLNSAVLGPGNCLGLLAAKSGPTAVRGQYYGFAAAVGKIGAFVGTWVFPSMISGA